MTVTPSQKLDQNVQLSAVDYDPFAGPQIQRVVPTTESQREVWLASTLSREASLAYNESVTCRFRGPLNVDALRAAIQDLVSRHDALRATISATGEELVFAREAAIEIPFHQLSEADKAADSSYEQLLDAAKRAAVNHVFDLENGPLVRAEIFHLGRDDHALIFTAHHVVFDGWSAGIMVQELANRYSAHLPDNVSPTLPALEAAMSYATYAEVQREAAANEARHADQKYWTEQFAQIPPNLDLPTDRSRKAWRSFNSARCDYPLDRELVQEVRRAGARMGASFFVTLLGAFGGLLQRLTGESALVVGVPAAGQSVGNFQTLIGHCVNLLPIKFDIASGMSFGDLIRATGAAMLDGYEHQEYTFGTLLKKLAIERDASRPPLVSVMFNLDTAIETRIAGFDGLELDFSINARAYENFEISVNAVQVDGGLTLQCQYSTDLFDVETIKRWLGCYEAVLRTMLVTEDVVLDGVSLISAADVSALSQWNNTIAPFPRNQLVHEQIENQVAVSPDSCAISWGANKISYCTLNDRADEIARSLVALGVGRGDLVGIHTLRGPDMVASVLAVLKTGAGYVPLDPKYPQDRLAFMVEDARLAALLTDQSLPPAVIFPAGKCVLLNEKNVLEDLALPDLKAPARNPESSGEDVAYVIYTSGSTGKPKGVRVPHRAVVNFLMSMAREPGMSKYDRIVAVTTLSFDIAVTELLLPLSVGAEIVLASSETAADGAALSALIKNSDATMMQATPSTWRLLLDCDWSGGRDFKLLCGGEALTTDLATKLRPRVGALWNMYGPTETTVWSTCCRIDSSENGLSIGTPIANTSVWVLDQHRQRCPIGVPGEIWIGGDGLTLGYLRRPDLTAERFIADPFSGSQNALLYQTGDRGRWRSDGQIEHMGRLDFQVKLRGYRIELGEIESALATHSDVSHALVIVRKDNAEDPRLVAYLVVKDGAKPDEESIKNYVRQTLPEYMVPQHVVLLRSLPLLPNGKVNRQALPSPNSTPVSARVRVAAANELERTVVATMAKILALPDISVEDQFFALGGHSLLASQLASQLSKQVGIQIPMRAVFEAPTARRLAAWIEQAKNKGSSAAWTIPRRADQSRAPLSAMQQRMWFLEQLDPGKTFHNTPSAHRLRGQLDEVAFARAFAEMVRRQDILRTIIVAEDESPVQHILAEVEYSLFPAIDLRALPPARRESELLKMLDELIAQPFHLDEPPLFCVKMFRLDDDEHVLFFMVHHIIWDGWSFDVLYEEIHALYDAFRQQRSSPLPELTVNYGDFADWQRRWMRTEDARAEVEHWRGVLAGAVEPLAVPTDYPRPAVMSGNGRMVWMTVPGRLISASRDLGDRAGATAYMTLLATYFVLLHQLTAQRDIVVGTPVRGRQIADLEPVMGFFVNAIPLRLQVREATTFMAFLTQVRDAVRLGLEHPDVPLEELVRELNLPRDRSRSPVFQAMFSYQDARRRNSRWGNLERERLEVMQPGVTTDLSMWTVELPDGLFLGLSYNTDIFSDDTAMLLRDRYAHMLQQFSDNPNLSIDELAMPPSECALLESWNSGAARDKNDARANTFAHSQFEKLAAESPARPAVRMGVTRLSYGELDARSNQVAQTIVSRGIGHGDLVGLFVNRSVDMLVALLGVLKSGAAYVPLDPAYPLERLSFMLNDAGIALLLTEQSLAQQLPFAAEKILLVDQPPRAPQSTARPALKPAPDAPAYVIYTSGSTGKPKGVVVQHRAVTNFLSSMSQVPGLSPADRLVAVTTLSFDIAVLELLLPLSTGAEVIIASREQASDAAELAALLSTSEATTMQATPATWRMLVDAGWQAPPQFKALIGGESLAKDLAERLLSMNVELWNMYGPTETTVWSTCWRVGQPDNGIFIGRPIANTQIYVLTPTGQICPVGVAGEIWIGGDGVALGYLNRPELTSERFIPDPFSTVSAGRLYRTGDRGRWRSDGQLEHLGRLDYQVKIRGFRIELGEIEETLASCPIVSSAVTVAREDVPGDVRLVAYVVKKNVVVHALGAEQDDSVKALREHLRLRLPAHMIPQHFVLLDTLPQLPNGKINRAALPLPIVTADPAKSQPHSKGPSTEMEKMLMAIWSELLQSNQIYVDDNFFDLGGHSLLAMQAIQRMEKATGKRVNPGRFVFESLAQIARGYDEANVEEAKKPGGVRKLFSKLLGAKDT